ncbi:hypothetical protein AcW1_000588 [Taiwanofungus camphoratus]|nr:hypothetical protein AcW1_000588 [Antrodia cinnamomea]
MSPTPISPNVVRIVLQYIAPPSQLSQPLPPFLLSRSLLQRHRFLQLSPDSPLEYLCWPSSADGQSRAIDLLEALSRPIHDDEPALYPVQYSHNGENTYAHVDLSSGDDDGARLVFEWDDGDGWKYHDTNMMPFPQGSRLVLQDVLARELSTQAQKLFIPPARSTIHGLEDLGSDDGDDDDYWNAYEMQEEHASLESHHALPVKDGGGSTEDAYWARYSSVHGTADSTQPSPPQPRRKLHSVHSDINTENSSPRPLPVPVRLGSPESHEDALFIPPSIIPRPIPRSKCHPASPHALAQLLSTISPRESASPSPAPGPVPPDRLLFGSGGASPTVGGSSGSDTSDTPLRTRPAFNLRELGLPTATIMHPDIKEYGELSSLSFDSGTGDIEAARSDAALEALRAGILGVWKMWKAGYRSSAGANSVQDEEDREVFLNIAEEVVRTS